MFGQNPIRKQELTDGLSLYIEDVWPTIQGEGPFALLPAIFIRTSGCWLRCYFSFGWKNDEQQPVLAMAQGLEKKLGKVAIGDRILTLVGCLEETEVINVLHDEVSIWYELNIKDGGVATRSYCVTPEHPFFTTRGVVLAEQIKVGDQIIHVKPEEITAWQKRVHLKKLKKRHVEVLSIARRIESHDRLPIVTISCSPHKTYLADGMLNRNCDTQFEDGMAKPPVPISEIEHLVCRATEKANTRLVVLTGGDPLRQNILPLIWRLCGRGFHVQLETAGIQWVPGLEKWVDPDGYQPQRGRVTVVCSPKTGKVNEEVSEWACAWKYIVSSDMIIDDDGLPSSSTQIPGLAQRLARPPDGCPREKIFLQPCDEQDAAKNAVNTALATKLAMRFGYRMSLQSHKTIGVE